MKKNLFLIVAIIVLLSGVTLFIYSSKQDLVYYITVEELVKNKDKFLLKSVKLAGKIEDIEYNEDNKNYLFQFYDGISKINVVYEGVLPPAAKNKVEALVDGKLINLETFKAYKIIPRCPSRYKSKIQ